MQNENEALASANSDVSATTSSSKNNPPGKYKKPNRKLIACQNCHKSKVRCLSLTNFELKNLLEKLKNPQDMVSVIDFEPKDATKQLNKDAYACMPCSRCVKMNKLCVYDFSKIGRKKKPQPQPQNDRRLKKNSPTSPNNNTNNELGGDTSINDEYELPPNNSNQFYGTTYNSSGASPNNVYQLNNNSYGSTNGQIPQLQQSHQNTQQQSHQNTQQQPQQHHHHHHQQQHGQSPHGLLMASSPSVPYTFQNGQIFHSGGGIGGIVNNNNNNSTHNKQWVSSPSPASIPQISIASSMDQRIFDMSNPTIIKQSFNAQPSFQTLQQLPQLNDNNGLFSQSNGSNMSGTSLPGTSKLTTGLQSVFSNSLPSSKNSSHDHLQNLNTYNQNKLEAHMSFPLQTISTSFPQQATSKNGNAHVSPLANGPLFQLPSHPLTSTTPISGFTPVVIPPLQQLQQQHPLKQQEQQQQQQQYAQKSSQQQHQLLPSFASSYGNPQLEQQPQEQYLQQHQQQHHQHHEDVKQQQNVSKGTDYDTQINGNETNNASPVLVQNSPLYKEMVCILIKQRETLNNLHKKALKVSEQWAQMSQDEFLLNKMIYKDPIEAGIITKEEAEKRFNIFKTHLMDIPHINVLFLPENSKYEEIRHHYPILFSAMIACASIVFEKTDPLFSQTTSLQLDIFILRLLSQEILILANKSLELLKSLLLLCVWFNGPELFQKRRYNILNSMLYSLMSDLTSQPNSALFQEQKNECEANDAMRNLKSSHFGDETSKNLVMTNSPRQNKQQQQQQQQQQRQQQQHNSKKVPVNMLLIDETLLEYQSVCVLAYTSSLNVNLYLKRKIAIKWSPILQRYTENLKNSTSIYHQNLVTFAKLNVILEQIHVTFREQLYDPLSENLHESKNEYVSEFFSSPPEQKLPTKYFAKINYFQSELDQVLSQIPENNHRMRLFYYTVEAFLHEPSLEKVFNASRSTSTFSDDVVDSVTKCADYCVSAVKEVLYLNKENLVSIPLFYTSRIIYMAGVLLRIRYISIIIPRFYHLQELTSQLFPLCNQISKNYDLMLEIYSHNYIIARLKVVVSLFLQSFFGQLKIGIDAGYITDLSFVTMPLHNKFFANFAKKRNGFFKDNILNDDENDTVDTLTIMVNSGTAPTNINDPAQTVNANIPKNNSFHQLIHENSHPTTSLNGKAAVSGNFTITPTLSNSSLSSRTYHNSSQQDLEQDNKQSIPIDDFNRMFGDLKLIGKEMMTLSGELWGDLYVTEEDNDHVK